MQKRILFVDDEPMVLMGLQRSLRPMREEWQMEFASGGVQALDLMTRQHFDAVVTDMRMPGMDGAELLTQVRQRFPQTVRFVLSGHSDQETVFRSITPAHQYLSKPCDVEQLRSKLAHTFALRELLENVALKKIVSQLRSVPSLPSLYTEITEELRSSDPSPNRVGKIISQDMGMTAKILQLSNSAFFALCYEVSQPAQAVSLLGLETIRALVLSYHVFSEFRTELLGEDKVQWLWEHSIAGSKFSKIIAQTEAVHPRVADDCFTAGLLHDVGKLVLASQFRKEYGEVLKLMEAEKLDSTQAEQQILGCSHGEIGAYLLGIWGLPSQIVEAVAWHTRPSDSPVTKFCPLAAAHVASLYHERMAPSLLEDKMQLDEPFLERIGLAHREAAWSEACARVAKVERL